MSRPSAKSRCNSVGNWSKTSGLTYAACASIARTSTPSSIAARPRNWHGEAMPNPRGRICAWWAWPLLVSTDFNIPLFSRVYPGNQPDSVTFGSVTQELIERYRVLAKNLEHVTLVFDKGNNSEENLEALGPSPYHVVGSLVPTQHPDLLEVPLDKFQSFQDARLEGVTAFRTSKKGVGRHWTIVATHSQELLEGQLRGIAQVLGKRRRALGELQGKLKRSQEPGAKGKGYTFESLEAHAQNL